MQDYFTNCGAGFQDLWQETSRVPSTDPKQRTNNMAIKVERMTRDFVFNNIHLPDPNPELPNEKVREIHAMTYPEISTAAVEGPEILGNRLRYTFSRAVEIRGAFAFSGAVPFRGFCV